MSGPQTYATHRRFDPWYHIVAFGLVAMAFLLAAVHAWRTHEVWPLVVSLALLLTFLKVRTYALRVQDRIIRLEETLRMAVILPEALRPRVRELTPGQFVALRFAADEELALRLQEALQEGLNGEAIKKRIQVWRPDTFRV